MERFERLCREALANAGAVSVRQRTHEKFVLPDGRSIVFSVSPSDQRAWVNAWADVRNVLGLNDPDRGKPGERRKRVAVRTNHQKPAVTLLAPALPTLRDKLQDVLPEPPVAQPALIVGKRIHHPNHHSTSPAPKPYAPPVDISCLLTRFNQKG